MIAIEKDRMRKVGLAELVEYRLLNTREETPVAPQPEPQAVRIPQMREQQIVSLYAQGERDFTGADLGRANLQGASLQNARLITANLCEAEMDGIDLAGARLSLASLRAANLRGAKLTGASLRRADLRNANLCEADLRNADLREADLRGVNLEEADLLGAKLNGARLDSTTRVNKTWRLIWEIVNEGTNGRKTDKVESPLRLPPAPRGRG